MVWYNSIQIISNAHIHTCLNLIDDLSPGSSTSCVLPHLTILKKYVSLKSSFLLFNFEDLLY